MVLFLKLHNYALNRNTIVFGISLVVLVSVSSIYFEYYFDTQAFAQYYDIAHIMGEKVSFEIDERLFDVYYGYKGSLDDIGSDFVKPSLASMSINQGRKSIEITMESVPERTDFWVRIPQEMLYAENENYLVLVDGVETKYGVMKFPDDYVVSFVITETTKDIEIIGTKIVPEFGMLSIAVLGISTLGMFYFIQRSKLKIYS